MSAQHSSSPTLARSAKRRFPSLVLALVVMVLILTGQAGAQSFLHVVVPTAFRDVEASSHMTFPWSCVSTSGLRQQQVMDGAAIGHGEVVTLRFRQDAELGAAFGPVTLPGVTVRLASTDQAIDTLSLVFADNMGADAEVVFQGDLQLSSAASAAVPRPWDVAVPLTSPFFFDGADGTNLLLDVTIPTCASTTAFDAAFTASDEVARIWENDADATVATRTDTAGLVIELELRFVFADGFELGDLNAWTMVVP